ncbi:type I-E CRISPR-associated protein Cse1/CasA [Nocardiopsis ansamitocini]|uniref:type I-E CRISPR-associated protein Cse1/CasA n=1 Tax=Nocardiopsis ansamitocini TaxID=1670832 RepID=UPI002555F593|nr:type I-E CRISPR-associated protein Cse1/CasA [Nocardiopsis ansamitocini]
MTRTPGGVITDSPSPGYDLATSPWVVAHGCDLLESPVSLGLKDVLLRAGGLVDVELPLPPASAMLWRVLVVITARASGLDEAEDKEEWQDRRCDLLGAGALDADAVEGYFAAHADRFDLFHPERPWMQDPRLRTECPKPSGVNKLAWGRTAGQNQVWLGGHHNDLAPRPLGAAEAAWHLLATLGNGPSGRCSARVVRGRNEANVTAGPLRGTVSYHPVGRTLFESLILNIPYPGDAERAHDLAPWERPDLDDPLGLPPAPEGPAAMLMGQARHAVLLEPSPDGSEVVDAWVTWARRERVETPLDPYLIYQPTKEGRLYARPADADRAVWRDLDALLRHGDTRGRRPNILDDCTQQSGVPAEILNGARLRGFGFDQDGQTRDRQWFAATTPEVLRWLAERDEEGTERVRTLRRIGLARASAEALGRRLDNACKDAWKAANSPGGGGPRTDTGSGPWARPAASRYWSRAEAAFWDIAHDRSTSGYTRGAAGPGNAFNLAALAAYDQVTGPYCERPRVARVVERFRSTLFDNWQPARAQKDTRTKEVGA